MVEVRIKNILGRDNMDKKRISVSRKRQITIPMKFHQILGIASEVDCYIRDGALVIKPIHSEYTANLQRKFLKTLSRRVCQENNYLINLEK